MAELICDECRETTKLDARVSDGRQLCGKCLKVWKRGSKNKAGDVFFRMAKTVSGLKYDHSLRGSVIVSKAKNQSAYTNGHFLISDFEALPGDAIFKQAHSGRVNDDIECPNVGKVIPKTKPDFSVPIPKDFYRYLKVFKPGRTNHTSVMFMDDTGVTAWCYYDSDITMHYNELDVSMVSASVGLSVWYLSLLQPKILDVHGQYVRCRGSYLPEIANIKVVLIAQIGREVYDEYKAKKVQ